MEPRPGRGRRDRLPSPLPSFSSGVGEFTPASDFPSSSWVHFEDMSYARSDYCLWYGYRSICDCSTTISIYCLTLRGYPLSCNGLYSLPASVWGWGWGWNAVQFAVNPIYTRYMIWLVPEGYQVPGTRYQYGTRIRYQNTRIYGIDLFLISLLVLIQDINRIFPKNVKLSFN